MEREEEEEDREEEEDGEEKLVDRSADGLLFHQALSTSVYTYRCIYIIHAFFKVAAAALFKLVWLVEA